MEKNNTGRNIAILVILFLILGGVIWYLQPKDRHNWDMEDYSLTYDEPYGLKFFNSYIKELKGESNYAITDSSLEISLPKYTENNGDQLLVHVSQAFHPDLDEIDVILDFLENGNDVFIAAKSVSRSFMEEIDEGQCSYLWQGNNSYNDSTLRFNFTQESLQRFEPYRYHWMYKDKKTRHSWYYFDSNNICEASDIEVIGRFNQYMNNLIKLPVNKGNVYLLSTPEMLLNYFLTQEDGQEVVGKMFSYTADKPHVVWDAKNSFSNYNPNPDRNDLSQNKGPLSYILSQESLKWAFYTFLISILTFLFFQAKRKQKSIPILAKKENSSIEYVETISEMYFQRDGHDKMLKYMSQQFSDHIRKRYRLTPKYDEERFIKLLAHKSAIDEARIERIIDLMEKAKMASNATPEFLIKYHQEVEYFYNHCK